ncbi:DNA binding protein [Streptomyces phage Moab]|nr:DNA binding protein [Streptomyces phage Moab]
MAKVEQVTVYDETIQRMAVRLGLTVEEVDAIMDMYTEESKQVHIERGHFKPRPKVASTNRTVVE